MLLDADLCLRSDVLANSVLPRPNNAVRGWGKKLTTAYNKTNPRNKVQSNDVKMKSKILIPFLLHFSSLACHEHHCHRGVLA